MKNLTAKIAATVLFLFFVFIGWFLLFMCETYFVFSPYIDTKMAENYTPSKFDKLRIKMNEEEVVQIIGEPLSVFIDTINGKLIHEHNYTNDGKILGKEMPFFMCNDYTWYRSSVFIKDNFVVRIDKGWSYD